MPNPTKERQNKALIALGSAIREMRVEQSVSQELLALRADIDRGYMGRIERGDNNVTVLTLLKIAEALDLSGSDLLAKAAL